MVHPAVAYEVAKERELSVDHGLYLIGSIAPDGIHTRTGATPEDKQRVHLGGREARSLRDRFHAIQEFRNAYQGSVDTSLLTGWVTHLVVDSIWSRHMVRGIWDQAAEHLSPEDRRK